MRVTFRITFTLLENFGKINFACVRMRNEIPLADIFPFNSTNEQSSLSYVILCIPGIHPRNRVIYFCLYTEWLDVTVTKLCINYINCTVECHFQLFETSIFTEMKRLSSCFERYSCIFHKSSTRMIRIFFRIKIYD